MKLKKELIEGMENLGWDIEEYDNEYLIRQYSNLGEDFSFSVNVENAIEEIINYCKDFDWEEHVEPLIEMRGERGVPNSIRDLIEDAQDIKNMLEELRNYIEENRYLGVDLQKYIGKKILAYGADKHRPCGYSSIGVIERIENNEVYIFCEKNPIEYRHYKINVEKLLRYEKEELYKIK